ncbi:F-box/kelch-repeat protein At1g16250 [Linum perenne]
MDVEHLPIIPGLPDDLAFRCLAKLSHGYDGILEAVSKRWKHLICSSEYANYKETQGLCGNWLFVLTEQSQGQWLAYDPEADRWRPLPKSADSSDWHHSEFSCVCVHNRLFVIGGTYTQHDSEGYQKAFVTNQVLQFDPFQRKWTRVASMLTPRSKFACSVVSGKIYVAGGCHLHPTGQTSLVEVYDPLTDKWEELPPMPIPQADCLGLSYQGRFYVVSNQAGLSDGNTSQVYDESDKTWTTRRGVWPFSRAMQFGVEVMRDGQVYTVVDGVERLIKTRDSEDGEWYSVGSVPAVILNNHARALGAFDCGFASLKGELYVLGGKVIKWEEVGAGRFDILRLDLVRVCDPKVRPLKWKETRPMYGFARGCILGCASLEEPQST